MAEQRQLHATPEAVSLHLKGVSLGDRVQIKSSSNRGLLLEASLIGIQMGNSLVLKIDSAFWPHFRRLAANTTLLVQHKVDGEGEQRTLFTTRMVTATAALKLIHTEFPQQLQVIRKVKEARITPCLKHLFKESDLMPLALC